MAQHTPANGEMPETQTYFNCLCVSSLISPTDPEKDLGHWDTRQAYRTLKESKDKGNRSKTAE